MWHEQKAAGKITLVVHLTDLHLSAFHDDLTRVSDLHALGSIVLSKWQPDALIITGVDGP